MIESEPVLSTCPRCGRHVMAANHAGMVVAINLEPVSAQSVAQAVVDGRMIYTVRNQRLVGIKFGTRVPDDAHVEHECGSAVVYRPVTPSVAPDPQEAPGKAAEGRTAPFSGPKTTASGAPSAETPASRPRTHPCEACRRPVTIDGPELYTAIELGATVVWATHETCV